VSELGVTAGDRFWPAHYLTEEESASYFAFLRGEARTIYNPFVEFNAKIQCMPEELQKVAVQEFVRRVDFNDIPKHVLNMVFGGMPSMKRLVLCHNLIVG
jgi:hypothetical protein